jgi:hypothetical protein
VWPRQTDAKSYIPVPGGLPAMTATVTSGNGVGFHFNVSKGMIGKRCRFHGGYSTGPTTSEGVARTVAALKVAACDGWLN